jgi:hypothetical protein
VDYLINKTNELLRICLNNFNQNSLSKNFGCFDRNYWSYKTIDFPTGMSQTSLYALALAYKINFKNNECYKNQTIKNWCEAGIQHAIKISNRNGSLDDYFPYEQAVGATCFVYISIIKTILLLNLKKELYKNNIKNTVKFISQSNESGILSNHKAAEILLLCQYRILYNDNSYLKYEIKKINELNSNYNSEGWFKEYDGCDLGYHTVTLSRLVDIYNLTKNKKILFYCKKMVNFSLNFINPDFTYGGHYSSRGTSICYLDGYAKIMKHSKDAIAFIKCAEIQLKNNLGPFYNDDKTSVHHLISYLETIKELIGKNSIYKKYLIEKKNFYKNDIFFISKEGISKIKKKSLCLFFSIKKGGSFSIYKKKNILDQDSGVTIKYKNKFYLSCYQNNLVEFISHNKSLYIKKYFSEYNEKNMSSITLIMLRILMNILGKYCPNFIRKILQKILIFNNKINKKMFLKRKIIINKKSILITDEIEHNIEYSMIQKPINPSYVVMSNVFNLNNIKLFKYNKILSKNKFTRKYNF